MQKLDFCYHANYKNEYSKKNKQYMHSIDENIASKLTYIWFHKIFHIKENKRTFDFINNKIHNGMHIYKFQQNC